MSFSSDLKRRVLLRTAAQPSPTRRAGRRRAAIVYASAIGAILLAFERAGGVCASRARPLLLTLIIGAGAALIALGATQLVAARRRSMLGASPLALACVSLALPAIVFFWLTSFHGRYVEPYSRVGWRCLGLELAFGAVLLAATAMLRKRTVPRSAFLLGTALGATCASWAGVLVDLWCPLTNPTHVVVGHLTPMLLLAAAGGLVGHGMLQLRGRPLSR